MVFITWAQRYHTGNEEIDAQHKQLVDIINELHDIRHSQDSQEVVNKILSRLLDHTEYHFDFEEKLMEKSNAPKLEEHKAEHQKLRNQIKEILEHQTKEMFRNEDMLMVFLERWLTKHILNEDMEAFSLKG